MRPRSVVLAKADCAALLAPVAGASIPDSAKRTPAGLGALRVGVTEAKAERIAGKNLRLQALVDYVEGCA